MSRPETLLTNKDSLTEKTALQCTDVKPASVLYSPLSCLSLTQLPPIHRGRQEAEERAAPELV